MASTADSKIVAPYIPWETFTDVMAHLKAVAVPGRIDKSALPSNMPNLVRGQVQSALRFLGLTDDKNKTSDTLRSLVKAYDTDKWATVLSEIIPKRYAGIIADLDLKDATPHQVDEKFTGMGITGQMAAKSIRFYLSALSAAGIPFSPYLSRRKQTTRKSRKGATAKGKRKETRSRGGKTGENANDSPPNDQVPEGMIEFPIMRPDGTRRKVLIPADVDEDDCDSIDAMLRAYAKRRQKGGQSK